MSAEKPRILIVEDERIFALDLKTTLEDMGYEAIGPITEGERALDAVQKHAPDLVLMDIHLSGQMLGTTAATHITTRHDVPVVFITAYADEDTLDQAKLSTPYGYLVKPIHRQSLEATLKVALARHDADRKTRDLAHRLQAAIDGNDLVILNWSWVRSSAGSASQPDGDHFDLIDGGHVTGQAPLLAALDAAERQSLANALAIKDSVSRVVSLRRTADLPPAPMRLTLTRLRSDASTPCEVTCLCSRVDLAESESPHGVDIRRVYSELSEAVVITDSHRRIVDANEAFHKMTGYALNECIGIPIETLLQGRRSGDTAWPPHENGDPDGWKGEVHCSKKNGEIFLAWIGITHLHQSGVREHMLAFVVSDITPLGKQRLDLSAMAYKDTLTKLGNRNLLSEKLPKVIEQSQGKDHCMAVLMLDLDGFKSVNDCHGHAVGDLVLQTVAERVSKCIRSTDIAVRLGGDEFVVVLTQIRSESDACGVAEKLVQQINRPIEIGADKVHVSASVGIAVRPHTSMDAEELMRHADDAMYTAKQRGKNGWFVFDETLQAFTKRRRLLEQDLRRAIDEGDIDVAYQPIVDTRTGHIVAMESLARWHHPLLGNICPSEFIPIAEACGLIGDLGTWIMRKSCEQMACWLRGGIAPRRIAVNVSGKELERSGYVADLEKILLQLDLPSSAIEIELTESAILDKDLALRSIEALMQRGVRVVIDDFGTGYSSLSLLKDIPVRGVKIDKSFVESVPQDLRAEKVVGAIMGVTSAIGLDVTAEGIECLEQLEFLRGIGCLEGQGYYFSPPVSAGVAESWLSRNSPLPSQVGFVSPDVYRSVA